METQIQSLNEWLKHWEEKLNNCEKINQGWETEYARRRQEIEEDCRKAAAEYNELKKKVMIYCHIAEDNSYVQFHPQNATPLEPDIVALSRMAARINESNRNDSAAGQVIELASGYAAWLDLHIAEIEKVREGKEKALLSQAQNFGQGTDEAQRKVMEEAAGNLGGEEIQKLLFSLQEWEKQYAVSEESLCREDFLQKASCIPVGWQEYPLYQAPRFQELLARYLGRYYQVSGNSIRCPKEIALSAVPLLQVEYTEKNREQLKSGIQALLLCALHNMGAMQIRISVFDEIYYSRELLGPLYALTGGSNGVIDAVPANEEEVRSLLNTLNTYYKKQEQKLGMQELHQYNASVGEAERLPYRILVLHRQVKQFFTNDRAELSYLLHNARRLGIFVIVLQKNESVTNSSVLSGHTESYSDEGRVCIVSDAEGRFFLNHREGKYAFSWLENHIERIPDAFLARVQSGMEKEETGTGYFSRFAYVSPQKSPMSRKPLRIPFAVNEEGKLVECEFENENFAAYMMGASRSGKSTLLHMMIGHVLMNYHPDEVELWLMDFKLTEFARYAEWNIPHIKYLLAEDSPELAYDILDKLTEELNRRKREFSRNGWLKQTEVPTDVYMPQIFVIIDEFARFSQYIRATKGEGYDKDYTLKLENMLAQGAALGFRFIFSSQTYSDGVPGLTETARKQIQTRFALKNTYLEIKDTLNLASSLITPEVEHWMNTLPVHESLFKWRDDAGEVRIERLKNMYMEKAEMEQIVQLLKESLPGNFVDKQPILLSGNKPHTFKEMLPAYRKYEAEMEDADLEEDAYIYAGVPRSFYPARPFGLNDGPAENILLVGGSREARTNVILSVITSYKRVSKDIEIWADGRNRILKRYRDTLFADFQQITDLEDILDRTGEIRSKVEMRRRTQKLVVLLGYEAMLEEWEMYGEDFAAPKKDSAKQDMAAMLAAVSADSLTEADVQKIEAYNQSVSEAQAENAEEETGDLLENMEWILRRASGMGIHFLVCFERPDDFKNSKLNEKFFRHRLAFSMNRTDSQELLGNGMASQLPEEAFAYSDGRKTFTMNPHIHRGIACNGWVLDETTGAAVPKE
ncbi:MAG: hypothetical protein HDR14_05000 [Lachnospiraceae bacterium]|nr:hypothetical protein [Lachnospiraceae bacterium]